MTDAGTPNDGDIIDTTGTVDGANVGKSEIALTGPNQTLIRDSGEKMTWSQREAVARKLVESGYLSSGIKTPTQAVAIMLKSEELGIPRMYGLSNIAIINGKPTCSAELMLALVKRDYGPGAIRVFETSSEECVVQYREPGWDGIASYAWTMDDARAANLANKEIWKQYPAAMLRARCISAVVRMAFPQSISGMYTPEELGADVVVNNDGEVLLDPNWSGQVRNVDTTRAKPSTTVIEHAPTKGEHAGGIQRGVWWQPAGHEPEYIEQPPATDDLMIADYQIESIQTLRKQLNVTDAILMSSLKSDYRVDAINRLTFADAADLIKRFRTAIDKKG